MMGETKTQWEGQVDVKMMKRISKWNHQGIGVEGLGSGDGFCCF